MDTPLHLDLQVVLEEVDAHQLDVVTRCLRAELSEFDVEFPPVQSTILVPGSKGDPIALGALSLAILPAVLPGIVKYLHDWAKRAGSTRIQVTLRDGGRSIELKLDNTVTSAEEAMLLAQRALERRKVS